MCSLRMRFKDTVVLVTECAGLVLLQHSLSSSPQTSSAQIKPLRKAGIFIFHVTKILLSFFIIQYVQSKQNTGEAEVQFLVLCLINEFAHQDQTGALLLEEGQPSKFVPVKYYFC